MVDFKIRLVKKNEFEELMKLMNTAFGFVDEKAKFEHILPKLYFKDNKDMIHYGTFVDGKLVASVGLYFMTFESKCGILKVGCVGAVSTHPDYRKNGYFSMIIKKVIKYAKNHNFDMLFLGGNRFRYNHFGFENAGRKLVVTISQRTKQVLKNNEFKVVKLDKNNIEDIQKCLQLYKKQSIRCQRTVENFYEHVISWGCHPYIVKVDDKLVGYYSINDDNYVMELVFDNKYLDTMLNACLNDKNEVSIEVPYSLYSNKLLSKVDYYEVRHCEMYNILNWYNVKKFLSFDGAKSEQFERLTKKEKIRALLGCDEFSTKFAEIDMFVYSGDRG